VDYSVWENLSRLVYSGERIRDVAHLRERICRAWEELPQNHIDNAIGQFRRRLRLAIDNEGGHIEPDLILFDPNPGNPVCSGLFTRDFRLACLPSCCFCKNAAFTFKLHIHKDNLMRNNVYKSEYDRFNGLPENWSEVNAPFFLVHPIYMHLESNRAKKKLDRSDLCYRS
jgi:hypothetical protein